MFAPDPGLRLAPTAFQRFTDLTRPIISVPKAETKHRQERSWENPKVR